MVAEGLVLQDQRDRLILETDRMNERTYHLVGWGLLRRFRCRHLVEEAVVRLGTEVLI